MPLVGIWKLSVASRRGSAAAAKLLPRRLRLLEDAAVEVPFEDGSTGSWRLDDGQVDMRIERASAPSLRLQGLYDGERIAGSITAANDDELGDFLCTRLFSFWGTPQPTILKDGEDR